jgi:hypothetical protein
VEQGRCKGNTSLLAAVQEVSVMVAVTVVTVEGLGLGNGSEVLGLGMSHFWSVMDWHWVSMMEQRCSVVASMMEEWGCMVSKVTSIHGGGNGSMVSSVVKGCGNKGGMMNAMCAMLSIGSVWDGVGSSPESMTIGNVVDPHFLAVGIDPGVAALDIAVMVPDCGVRLSWLAVSKGSGPVTILGVVLAGQVDPVVNGYSIADTQQ